MHTRDNKQHCLIGATGFSLGENPSIRFLFRPRNGDILTAEVIDSKGLTFSREFEVGNSASSLPDLGNRREVVGNRVQICERLRRMVDLFDEKVRRSGPISRSRTTAGMQEVERSRSQSRSRFSLSPTDC